MSQFRGIAFPFQKGKKSFPAGAEDDELIKQSLVQLVMTGKNERIMRPDVGAASHRYIFENNDEILQQLAETEIAFLINRYEPRVSLTSISAVRGDQLEDIGLPSENEASSVVITIRYIVLATRRTDQVTLTLSPG